MGRLIKGETGLSPVLSRNCKEIKLQARSSFNELFATTSQKGGGNRAVEALNRKNGKSDLPVLKGRDFYFQI
jgi:hypothetical protein